MSRDKRNHKGKADANPGAELGRAGEAGPQGAGTDTPSRVRAVAGFETLWVWQKAHQLMLEVHEIAGNLPRSERFGLRVQIERSSSSVPDNIAEGHTSYYYNDKIKAFNTARKEAGETQNHVRSVEGKGFIAPVVANDLVARYEEVIRGINGYVNWVRRKKGASK